MKRKSKAARKTAPKAKRSAASSLPELHLGAGEDGLRQAIGIMSDGAQPADIRAEALRVLQASSFGAPDFAAIRGDYIGALRTISADAEPVMRHHALEILALEGDAHAEKVLVAGLRDPKKALVSAGDALQYLSNNVHAGVQSLARSIFASSDDDGVRQQALRLMARDPESAKTIQKTLADKKESSTIRQMSAAALQALDPKAMQAFAKKAVMDDSEHKDVVATCLTAMHQFGDAEAIMANKPLQQRIASMRSKGSAQVKQRAKELAVKYGL